MATTESTTSKVYRIGVFIGSQRPVRAGPQISDFVLGVIKQHLDATGKRASVEFDVIDVAALGLPLLDEPGVPSQIKDPSGYKHEHTRAWSRRVSALDGFVFVTPQYNWGVPAGLKNAIDYLFNEFVGKPAMVVSYGGHGGDKVWASLRLILGGGIDMRVAETPVNLTFPGRAFLVKAATGTELGLDPSAQEGTWADQKEAIIKAWGEVVAFLEA